MANLVINNGAEAEIVVKPTEKVIFVGKNGIDGVNPNLLDYVKRNELGDMAFEDLVEWAKLGQTIIIGGYIRTEVIDTYAIRIQGNLATQDDVIAKANLAVALGLTDFSNGLGDLAFADLVSAAKLDQTIIIGGYIRTALLDVEAIRIRGGLALNADAQLAIRNAADALQMAVIAQQSAERALVIIGGIAKDNMFSAFEKPPILKEWTIIQSEVPTVVAQADKYAVSTVAYLAAYNALDVYISPMLANMNTDTPINGTEFINKFKNYYDTKIALLKLVTDKAKEIADDALAKARAAAEAAAGATTAVGALRGELGEVAFLNAIGLAKLDSTVIQGGYIKSTLLDVNVIRVMGDFQTVSGAQTQITTGINNFKDTLGTLAFDSFVGLAKLDSTIIVGGYIKTSLIDAVAIRVAGGGTSTADVNSAINTFKGTLGTLAYQNLVGKAMLDTTLIVGGYIDTTLINTSAIIIGKNQLDSTIIVGGKLKTEFIDVDFIKAIGITATYLQSGTTGSRFEINVPRDGNPAPQDFRFYHTNGNLGIDMGIENGLCKLNFYNSNGVKIYELGQSGITFVTVVPESWDNRRMTKLNVYSTPLSDADKQTIRLNIRTGGGCDPGEDILGIKSNMDSFSYNPGTNSQTEANKQYLGIHKTEEKLLTNFIDDGWYMYPSIWGADVAGQNGYTITVLRFVSGLQVEGSNISGVTKRIGSGTTCPNPL